MITLIIITTIFIATLVWSILILKEDLTVVSIISLAAILIFGWGLFGNTVSKEIYITEEKCSIAKTDTRIFVEYGDGHVEKYSDMRDYKSINDSTYFYKIKYYNMYGSSCNTKYIYKSHKIKTQTNTFIPVLTIID